ncbi:MAG: hypothetical protein BMS9Abin36_0336 [Gammaproteobacteria bacterium]|nr:MAG: hypothetical protein BMS9Abin36_0336 [Gammaproteobacteria bacterium]
MYHPNRIFRPKDDIVHTWFMASELEDVTERARHILHQADNDAILSALHNCEDALETYYVEGETPTQTLQELCAAHPYLMTLIDPDKRLAVAKNVAKNNSDRRFVPESVVLLMALYNGSLNPATTPDTPVAQHYLAAAALGNVYKATLYARLCMYPDLGFVDQFADASMDEKSEKERYYELYDKSENLAATVREHMTKASRAAFNALDQIAIAEKLKQDKETIISQSQAGQHFPRLRKRANAS